MFSHGMTPRRVITQPEQLIRFSRTHSSSSGVNSFRPSITMTTCLREFDPFGSTWNLRSSPKVRLFLKKGLLNLWCSPPLLLKKITIFTNLLSENYWAFLQFFEFRELQLREKYWRKGNCYMCFLALK